VETQLSMPLARTSDPETAQTATENSNLSRDRALVLGLLNTYGPSTDFDLAGYVNRQQTSLGKRRLELQRLGFVERAPLKPRKTPSGAHAIVWQLTEKGRREAARPTA